MSALSGVPILETRDLRTHFRRGGWLQPARWLRAVDGVSFTLGRQETLGLVGESGSGKTTIARCIAGLHAPTGGTIALDGTPLAAHAGERPREARRRVQIVFQNPFDSLNPRQRIGEIVAEPARLLLRLKRGEAQARALELLERVRLSPSIADRYPRELSGGERQRVAIARALAPDPTLLVCDEVTSALDVSVQAAVLDLLVELRTELHLAMLFITHDLGVVATIADRVLVLERGAICEQGRVAQVLHGPTDAYTQTLVAAAPRLDITAGHAVTSTNEGAR
jgi:peptide/nickel transport system ATP-binding protein